MKFLNLSVERDCTTFSCEFNQNTMLTFTLYYNEKDSQLEVFAKEEEGGFGDLIFRKKYKYVPSLEMIVADVQNAITTEGKKYWTTVGKIEGLTSAINQINRNAIRNPIHSDHLSILRAELAEERRNLIKEVKRK